MSPLQPVAEQANAYHQQYLAGQLTVEDFKELISVIQQPAELEYWDQFLEVTRGLDQIRKENFQNTFPEFAKIIDFK